MATAPHYIGFVSSDSHLLLDGTPLSEIAKQIPSTPCFIYSKSELIRRAKVWLESFPPPHAVYVAVKANPNPYLLSFLSEQGLGATVVSAGELRFALRAGFPPRRLFLHGNGKHPEDIRAALETGALLNVDSAFDLKLIMRLTDELSRPARLLLRLNPTGVEGLHPYLTTSGERTKFGLSREELNEVLSTISTNRFLEVVGLHLHLGSNLTDPTPYQRGLEEALKLLHDIRHTFPHANLINLGGGLAVDYQRKKTQLPSPQELARLIIPQAEGAGVRLMVEPGRHIFAQAGAILTRVLGLKHRRGRFLVVVDASMNINPRPALYGAHHTIIPLENHLDREQAVCDVVGPICEEADFLARDTELSLPREGEILCVLDCGAYCMSMASRYNLRPLPPEYLWEEGELRLIRRPELPEEMLSLFPTPSKD